MLNELHDNHEGLMNQFVVRGQIVFPNGAIPEHLPTPSILRVGVSDTAMADAPEVPCGSVERDVSGEYR